MKRFLYIALLCAALLGTHSSQAQSLDDLMKGLSSLFSSEPAAKEPVAEVHPATTELLGRLRYDALTIDYKGDSTLASLAVATLESQLPLIAEKAGFVAGRDYLEVLDDGTMHIVRDGKRATAYCSSYDEQTGRASIMMQVDEQTIRIVATVIKADGGYRVLFDATELFALMAKHYSKFEENTTLQMAKGVIDAYPGIRVGAVLRK